MSSVPRRWLRSGAADKRSQEVGSGVVDNQRLFLWVALALVLWLTYQAWVEDYATKPAPVLDAPGEVSDGAPPVQSDDERPQLPTMPGATEPQESPGAEQPSEGHVGTVVTVTTDVLELTINTLGADISKAVMLGYPVQKKEPDVLVTLENRNGKNGRVISSTLISPDTFDLGLPYVATATEYNLAPDADTLEVNFRYAHESGLLINKTYTYQRGSYHVRLRYEVINGTQVDQDLTAYLEIRRPHIEQERSFTSVESYSFRGPVIYDGDSYDKLDADDLEDEPVQLEVSRGWIAVIQNHFLAAAIPDRNANVRMSARYGDGDYRLSVAGPRKLIAAGATEIFEQDLFVGPKLQDQMAATADGLKLTVDYGWLTIISQPLFWLLSKIYSFVGNWGWTIIIMTMLIKLLFYKLSETSGHSMARMRKLQPRIKHLQERYKDDRQALSQAMMELYKKEKVNPAAGCLPMLVQMPVFLAFYWVLLESVELRQAPFMLWIQDLSSRDPYFILPILMGVSMLGQQKLNPAPPDPVQAKIMMLMPVVFTVFFAFFPAGLVLYWFVNTLLSIAQQWRINKVTDAAK